MWWTENHKLITVAQVTEVTKSPKLSMWKVTLPWKLLWLCTMSTYRSCQRRNFCQQWSQNQALPIVSSPSPGIIPPLLMPIRGLTSEPFLFPPPWCSLIPCAGGCMGNQKSFHGKEPSQPDWEPPSLNPWKSIRLVLKNSRCWIKMAPLRLACWGCREVELCPTSVPWTSLPWVLLTQLCQQPFFVRSTLW